MLTKTVLTHFFDRVMGVAVVADDSLVAVVVTVACVWCGVVVSGVVVWCGYS
jgi:hypothetical protein